VEPASQVRLLWREEVLRALAERGHHRLRAPRRELWRALADTAPPDEVRRLVCEAIRSRPGWRAAS
jgi:hypothetical protein